MKEILNSKYSRFFLVALLVNLLCSWFSIGFNQVDEHYQVLEFCNCKMGHSPASALPWEFHDKIRSSLLPTIAYLIGKAMTWWGIYNPFILAFLLRLIAGFSSWYIVSKLCILLAPKFKSRIGEKLFVLMALFLWFVPYLNVRFTSENISGILFLYGLYWVLKANEKSEFKLITFLCSGLILGLAFFTRFHLMFAVAGLVAWFIFIKKIELKYIFILAFSALIAVGLSVLLDYWFYGTWTFSPYNYYYANIVQHRAASFGVSPWWFYFSDFVMRAVPPLSAVLLIMFFAGIYKNLKNVFVWIIVPFVILHLLTGHKELRFFFPVVFIFIYVAALGFDTLLLNEKYQKIHKYVYVIFWIICLPLLVFITFTPAQVAVSYTKYLYDNTHTNNTPLFILRNEDYSMVGYKANFYNSPNVKNISLDSLSQVKDYIRTNQPKMAYYLDKDGTNMDGFFHGYKSKMVYCYYPAFVLKWDINKWQERSHIWKLYQLDKVD